MRVRAFWIFGIDILGWAGPGCAGGMVGPVRDERLFKV
jgi:hypothetical protein